MTDYGKDILLDKNLQPMIAANGELLLTKNNFAVLQDVCLRLRTVIGTLFYDETFGSRVFYYLKDSNSKQNRMALKTEIARTIKMEDRVDQATVLCRVLQTDSESIEIEAELQISGDSQRYVISVSVSKDTINVGVR